MYREKLSKPLLRRLKGRVVLPIIVKARYNVEELWAELSQYELSRFAEARLFSLLPSVFPFNYSGLIRRFGMLSGIFASRDIEYIADHPYVEKVYLDVPMEAFQFPTVPPEGVYRLHNLTFTSTFWTRKILGAEELEGMGYTGRGVKVAVPDTGATLYHEQLGARLSGVQFETVMPAQRGDSNGHGTWCLTCIGGAEAVAEAASHLVGQVVRVKGIAPDAELLAIKVLGYVIGTGSTSQIIKGLELAAEWDADVISMSLGGPVEVDKPEDDPFYPVIKQLTEEGRIVVVAAGNEGPDPQTIASPGAMPHALTVGAYDPVTGEVADFSSRGPTPWGDTKPDVIMPGVNIESGSTGILDVAVEKLPDHYAVLSGTSMATPHAAGMAALFRQVYRELLGRELTRGELYSMVEAYYSSRGVVKSNDFGWGPITVEVLKEWLGTQYGVELAPAK